jgi:hypothetical protein
MSALATTVNNPLQLITTTFPKTIVVVGLGVGTQIHHPRAITPQMILSPLIIITSTGAIITMMPVTLDISSLHKNPKPRAIVDMGVLLVPIVPVILTTQLIWPLGLL